MSEPTDHSSPSNFHAQLLEALGQAVVATDMDGTITYWNSAAESLFGWKSTEIVGLNVGEVLAPTDGSNHSDEVFETVQNKRTWKGDVLAQRRDGTVFPAHVTCSPIIDESDHVVGTTGIIDDITDRRSTERERELEKDRLEFIFDRSHAFIVVLRGADHVIEMANAAYQEHVGQANLPGKKIIDLVSQDVRPEIFAILDFVYATGDPYLGKNMRIVYKRGSDSEPKIQYEDVIYQPLKSDSGTISGVLVIGVDVTENVHAHMKAQKAERTKELILDRSVDIICTLDRAGRFVTVSAASKNIWGYDPEEVQGRRFSDYVTEEDIEATWRNVLQEGELNHFENRTVSHSGDIVHMMWTTSWSEEDQVFYAFGRDITQARNQEQELKDQETALRHSQARYKEIIDTANDGVWLVDKDANTSYVNPRMTEIIGYSADEMAGKKVFDFVSKTDKDELQKRFQSRKRGVRDYYDIRLNRKDGSLRWVQISASPFHNDKGEFSGSLGMVTDITVRKQAEQALIEAKEKAEEMARLKSSFLTNMSHEIRTPLASIISLADLLEEEVSGETQTLVNMMRIGGERLLLTLDSVLALAQLESKSMQLAPTSVDLTDQAKDVISMFESQAKEKGLYVRLEAERKDLVVNTDAGAVSRILTNLINNALKFTESGGVIVRLGKDNAKAWIQISDTGIGIGDEFVSKLFEEFQQESEGSSRSHEGAGLGLAISKRLVDLMGGNICVYTNKGEGTSFTICLPLDLEKTYGHPAVIEKGLLLNQLASDRGAIPGSGFACRGDKCRVHNRGTVLPIDSSSD